MRDAGGPGAASGRMPPGRDAFRFWTEEKLRNADTDQFGHVNNAAVASLFEAGRMELFGNRPEDPDAAPLQIVVVRLLMNYHKELYYPGQVAIGTVVTRVGRTSFDLAQGLFLGSTCFASSEATCVAIDPASRQPAPIPAAMRGYLAAPHRAGGSRP